MIAPRFSPPRVRDYLATPLLGDEEIARLRGFHPQRDWYDRVLPLDGDSVRGNRADGSPLFVVLRGALSAGALKTAYDGVQAMNAPPLNRGSAAGRDGRGRTLKGYRVVEAPDGRLVRTKTNQIPNSTIKHLRLGSSGVIGSIDREDRFPYCRPASANGPGQVRLRALEPIAREVEQLFAYAVPERFAEQRSIADRTRPCWLIAGTCFTTITVNKNFQCGTHQDVGDYKPGFSNLVMIRAGQFDGGYLVLPKYRLAIELNTGDVLFFDPHEWHGTSPILGLHKRFQRITLVLYYRTGMADCGTVEEEIARGRLVSSASDLR